MNCKRLLCVTLLLLGGCDGSPDHRIAAAVATPAPAGSPGYLRLPINGAVTTLDPGLTEDIVSIELTEQLFLALTAFNPGTYKVEPALATHWRVFDNGRRYRFYLREDAFWSDGQAVTAQDIVWAVRRNLDPKTQSPYASALWVLANAQALHQGRLDDVSRLGARAVDSFTVEFRLQQPLSHFPALVSLWVYRPLPRRAIERWGEHWTLPGKLVSNGPYQLQDWQRGRQLTLRKNPYYFGADQVRIEEVRYLTVVDNALGLSLYRQNELDVMGGLYLALPRAALATVQRDPLLRADYRQQATLCSETYAFNHQRAPTNDPRVRRAIAAAIDRDLLVEVFMQGAGQASRTFIPPGLMAGQASPPPDTAGANKGIDYDPQQARAWLAEAGYPEGKGLPPLTLVYNRSGSHRKVALVVQKMLQHTLGIRLELRELSWQGYQQAIQQPATPHLFRFGWCADYPDPYSWLGAVVEPGIALQRLGWRDADFQQQLARAAENTDPTAQGQAYAELEWQLLNEHAALLPLYFQTAQYLVKPWVTNWSAMPFGGQPIKDWGLVVEETQ